MRFASSLALRTPPPPAPAARGTRLHLAHAPPRPLTAHSEPPTGRVKMLAPPAPRRFGRVLRRVMCMVFTMVGRRGVVRRTPAVRNSVRDDERCASGLYWTVERYAFALYGDGGEREREPAAPLLNGLGKDEPRGPARVRRLVQVPAQRRPCSQLPRCGERFFKEISHSVGCR